jgi:5-methylthioadenosine/S-adenosylhomocysteine deaminase
MSRVNSVVLAGMLILLLLLPAHAQNLILGGTVVTPDRVLPTAWIIIKDGLIDSIVESPPAGIGVTIVETGGIMFPGFVDLHNHPMYNIFARWNPPKRFSNRYEWRDLQEYKDFLGTPGGNFQKKGDQTFCDIDEYVEVRSLIGGTTSIAGISARRDINPPVPNCVAGLIRNLDWASGFYESGIGHERIENALGVAPRDMNEAYAQKLRDDIAQNKIDLLLVHVAEGSPQDMESSLEFRALKGEGLLGERTSIIHGVALQSDEFKQMWKSHMALVWSPRSNMELYGVTTNIAAALREGVTVALAPDWSPTGSANMLSELQYASRFSHEQMADLLSDRQLLEMATSIPARIAKLDSKIGSLRPKLYADLFVLKGDTSHPFAALANARAQDVQLVLVGGVPLYGSSDVMKQFQFKSEAIDICGTKMALNSSALPAGRFSEVEQRLKTLMKGNPLGLALVADCKP